jgi:exosortase/archaeosortase family protein
VEARGLTEAHRFGLRFFALLIVATVIAWAINMPARLATPQRWLASSATSLARLTGGAAEVAADKIGVGHLTIDINYECTGIYVLMILCAFLLAYPASWGSRLAGAAVGVALLTAVNVLRISVLVRIAELWPSLFGYFHEYVWQGVFLVLVIVYAMSWVERVE